MSKPNGNGQGLVALFVVGDLPFNYPMLALFNRADMWSRFTYACLRLRRLDSVLYR
jgi:hypothetical protein